VSERTFIRDMQPAQYIEGIFAIQNCQLGQTKTGKPYIKCLLADRSGRTPGRMWNATEELYQSLPTNGFVWLEGQTQPYQGEMQVIINRIRSHEPTEQELKDLLPVTQYNVDEMFAEVIRILQTMENPAIKSICDRYFEDGQLMDLFCKAPAATTLHHAYLGGLLEHTLSLLKLADRIMPLYPELNRDIMLLGLFLHDLGKCCELNWDTGFSYSEDGMLIGHIARGVVILEEKVRACREMNIAIPDPTLRVLQHIILSHHGQLEFGAAKLPATPEAIAISILDNLDAKMNMALAATRDENGDRQGDLGGNFTEKIWALGTRLYRPDPTKLSQEHES